MSTKQIEWAGCLFGLAGALLLALNNQYSGFGFALFLISNFFWIAYAILIKAKGMFVMQLGFTTTSLVGIYKWIF